MSSLVSIIIPTYNRAHLIGQTLDSVLVQTYEHWECIVVDDGSTDYTDELLAFYCERDSRIQYHNRPVNHRKGANACRNYGFELSKGEYINWLDSDDLMSENKLKDQLIQLKDKKNALATSVWGVITNGKVQMFRNLECFGNFDNIFRFLNLLFKEQGYFPLHSYLMDRNLIERSGSWNEYLTINQDSEFIIRVLCFTDQVIFSKTAEVLYRKHSRATTSFINHENINDYFYSWNLINALLQIRFKKEFPEFEIVRKNFTRKIPLKFLTKYKTENILDQSVLKERLATSFKKKIKNWIKARL